MVEGWLFKIVYPGNEPDTRRITSWWAAWHRDEAQAVSAVAERSGIESPTETSTLTEKQLRLLGLNKPGDVLNVKNEL